MTSDVRMTHEPVGDVLYALRSGVHVAKSRTAPEDDYLILNMDTVGNIVGVQLICAATMPVSFWKDHPDREIVPQDLLTALDTWIGSHNPK